MCNCKKELEAKLLDNFISKFPDVKEHSVELKGYCLGITDKGLVLRSYMPYSYEADYPLKKGGYKHKKQEGNFVFSYCPFCGGKIKEKE